MTLASRRMPSRGRITTMALLLLCCWMLPSNHCAAKDKDKEKEEPPEPEQVELECPDGLTLYATYYPGTKGKKTVPVVILHDMLESSEDYQGLALFLQKKGHAIVLPDMRGHGQSTEIVTPQGRKRTVDKKRISKQDFRLMVLSDMTAIRSFLLKENNSGNLNVEKLCVVGTGASALLAAVFAVEDWSWNDLAFAKQGKDVKALVLISPERAYKKFSIKTFIDDRRTRGRLSLLILVGREDKKKFDSASRIHTLLSNYYPEPEPKQAAKAKALFFLKRDTVFQGEELLNTEEFKCFSAISAFIQARLVAKKMPWSDRRTP